jgi:hypothetical protein
MQSEFDAKYWREKANQTRAKALGGFFDEQRKNRMLNVADEYDRLANRAETSGPTDTSARDEQRA